MTRARLPNRRPVVTGRVTFEADDGSGGPWGYHVSVGVDPATGAPREIFVRPSGGTKGLMEAIANDVGILVSRLLQHGDDLSAIAAGLGGRGGSPVAAWVAGAMELASFDAGTHPGALAQDEGSEDGERRSPRPVVLDAGGGP